MPTPVPTPAPGSVRDTRGPTPAPGSYAINFAIARIEDPLSAGGVFSNNTQGVGGNGAPGNLSNMRVALGADGVTRIAMGTPNAQVEYEDAFAFKPGVGRNMRLTAVLYRAPGYAPAANHEVELLLGCKSADGSRRWIECLLNVHGGADILSLDGGPSDFRSLGGGTSLIDPPQDGQVMMAELVDNTVSWYLNGLLAATYTGPEISELGDGAGIAVFYREGADPAGFGFRSLRVERL